MNSQEIAEAEQIHKEDALEKIAAMMVRFNITQDDIVAILPNAKMSKLGTDPKSESKLFDPFFDAY